MKIIFDQSAFHYHFDPLKGSRLLELTHDGKITVYHTATFLDETLRMGARADRQDKLKRQWPFLQSICNGGWFRLLFGQQGVCEEELDGGTKNPNWPLVPSSWRTDFEAKMNRFLEGSGPLPELITTRPDYDRIWQDNKHADDVRLKLRTEQKLPKDVTFTQYFQAHFFLAAELVIRQVATLNQPEAKFEAWKRDPTKFPHVTAFVGLWIYSFYEAEKYQNSRLDRNWMGDAEQLCFLVDVDGIVSSDHSFMKRAFQALWQPNQQPSQERFFTPDEFVDFLSQL
jgi:hypothetical protein